MAGSVFSLLRGVAHHALVFAELVVEEEGVVPLEGGGELVGRFVHGCHSSHQVAEVSSSLRRKPESSAALHGCVIAVLDSGLRRNDEIEVSIVSEWSGRHRRR
jgi:hypothetical protein